MVLPALLLAGCGEDKADQEAVTVGADPREAIAGTWYPQEIAGYTVDPLNADSYAEAYLEFSDGKVVGSDGCNQVRGTYRLEADGAFELEQLTSTRMACANVPHHTVMDRATRVEVDGQSLIFGATDEVARYGRSQSPPAEPIVRKKTEPEIPPGT
ncbi:hypothetical protein GCM10027456_46520 [Kineosporia babensis]